MTNKELLLQKLIFIASGQIGSHEEGGNNKGPMIVEYQKATWLAPDAWAWCAALQCWVLREWLKCPDVLTELNLTEETAKDWRCQDASAFGWEKWAKQKGLKVVQPKDGAKAGDFVIFEFSHIGIVSSDQKDNIINTIEGNTNNAGERDSNTGDGVWAKQRNISLVKCYVRLF
jgi:hypothetical protein